MAQDPLAPPPTVTPTVPNWADLQKTGTVVRQTAAAADTAPPQEEHIGPPPVDPEMAGWPGFVKTVLGTAKQTLEHPQQAVRTGLSFIPPVTSAVGGTLGFSRGGVGGAMLGAGAGQAVGEVASLGAESYLFGPPKVDEVLNRVGNIPLEAGISAVTEPVTFGVTKGLSFLADPVKVLGGIARRSMSPEAQELTRYTGGKVLPHEVSDHGLLKFFGNIIEGAPTTQGQYQRFIKDRQADFVKNAESIILSPGERATRQEGGTAIREGLVANARNRAQRLAHLGELRAEGIRDTAGQRAAGIRATAAGEASTATQTAAAKAAGIQGEASASSQALTAEAKQLREEAFTALANSQDDLAAVIGNVEDELGPDVWGHERIGNTILGLREVGRKQAAEDAGALFNRVWERTKDQGLDLSALFERSGELASEAGKVGRRTGVQGSGGRAVGALEGIKGEMADAAAEHAEAIAELPGMADARQALSKMAPGDPRRARFEQDLADASAALSPADLDSMTATPQQVHNLRSFYGRMERRTRGTPENGVFSQLYQAADRVMDMLPEEDAALYRQAITDYKAMADTYDRYVLGRVAKTRPQEVLNMIMPVGKKSAPEQIHTVREMVRQVGGEDAWRQVQAQKWFDLAYTPDGKPVSPKKLLANLQQIDQESLTALFGETTGLLGEIAERIPQVGEARAAAHAAERSATGLEQQAGKALTTGEKQSAQALAEGERGAAQALASGERQAGRTIAAGERAATTLQGKLAARGTREIERQEALPTHNLVAESLAAADASGAAKLRTIVGPEDWKQVQSVDLQNMLGRVEELGAQSKDLVSPKQLTAALNRRGKEAFVATHSQQLWDQLWSFSRNWTKVNEKAPGGSGKMWINLVTPAAASAAIGYTTSILTGSPAKGTAAGLGSAGLILLGPKMIARIFYSPRMRAELLKGMSAQNRGDISTASRALGQLSAMLLREKLLSPVGPPGSQQIRGLDDPPAGRGAGPGPNTGAGGAPPAVTPTPQGATERGGPPLWDTLEALTVIPGGSASKIRQVPLPEAAGRAGGPPRVESSAPR